jgi:hypothetical protein
MSDSKKGKVSKKGGGGNLTRSVTVTVRMDPKMRYLTELAARSQRRTVSSFIEWAIEQSFSDVNLIDSDFHMFGESCVLSEVTDKLWNVHESSRFINLVFIAPGLLTHREQIIWQLLRDSGVMESAYMDDDIPATIDWKHVKEFIHPAVRKHWDEFSEVADGIKPEDSLPKW